MRLDLSILQLQLVSWILLVWPIISTNLSIPPPTTQQGYPIQVTFENKKRFKAFSKTTRDLIYLWYPYIVNTLGLNGVPNLAEPLNFPIFYLQTISPNVIAGELKGTLIFSINELVENPQLEDNQKNSIVIHELTHAIGLIYTANTPKWITEGISDWIAVYHYYERSPSSLILPNNEPNGYLQGYKPAAYFLERIRQTMCPDLIPKLVKACRRHPLVPGAYSDRTFWTNVVGHEPEDLWNDMLESGQNQQLTQMNWNTPNPIPKRTGYFRGLMSELGNCLRKTKPNMLSSDMVPQVEVVTYTQPLKSYAKLLKRHLRITLPQFPAKLPFPYQPLAKVNIKFSPETCTEASSFHYLENPEKSLLEVCSKSFEEVEQNKAVYLDKMYNAVGMMMLRKLTLDCPSEISWLVDGLASWVSYFNVIRPGFEVENVRKCSLQFDKIHMDARLISYFFQWMVETYDTPDMMVPIANALFEKGCPYRDEIWLEVTGKSIDESWADMVSQAQALAEVL